MIIVAIEASLIIMGSLLIIPAVSLAPIRILTRWYPQRQVTRIHLGLRTRWFITGFFVLALILNTSLSYWFLGFATYLAIKEYFTTMPTRRVDRRLIFVIYMLIPLQLLFMANQFENLSMLFLPVFVLIGLPIFMRSSDKHNFYDALMLMQWGILATMWSLCVPLILWKDSLQTQPIIVGIMLMFFLIGLSQFNKLLRKNVFPYRTVSDV
jgi:phosphatidate cytidylyltransferase